VNVFSFYQSSADLPQAEEFERANWWKRSWMLHEWNPVMLNSSHVVTVPGFTRLNKRVMEAFQRNVCNESLAKFSSRYYRWLALSMCGGWVADYDVVNMGFTPEMAKKAQEKSSLMVSPGKAWIFYASREMAAAAVRKLTDSELFKDGVRVPEIELVAAAPVPDEILCNLVHARGEPRSRAMQELLVPETEQVVS